MLLTDYLKVVYPNSDENWEFTTGNRVKCMNKKFSDGSSGLVAIKKV